METEDITVVFSEWRQKVLDLIKGELKDATVSRIPLTNLHPGGLAQLYADNVTSLGRLIRNQQHYEATKAKIKRLLENHRQLEAKYGHASLHLVIGLANWQSSDESGHNVPVLMRPLRLQEYEGDYLITLKPTVEISNRFLGAIVKTGSGFRVGDLLQSIRSKHGFSPGPALAQLRQACQSLRSFSLQEILTLGIFVHPLSAYPRELANKKLLESSAYARILAGERTEKNVAWAKAISLPEDSSANLEEEKAKLKWYNRLLPLGRDKLIDSVKSGEVIDGGTYAKIAKFLLEDACLRNVDDQLVEDLLEDKSYSVQTLGGGVEVAAALSVLKALSGKNTVVLGADPMRLEQLYQQFSRLGLGWAVACLDNTWPSTKQILDKLVYFRNTMLSLESNSYLSSPVAPLATENQGLADLHKRSFVADSRVLAEGDRATGANGTGVKSPSATRTSPHRDLGDGQAKSTLRDILDHKVQADDSNVSGESITTLEELQGLASSDTSTNDLDKLLYRKDQIHQLLSGYYSSIYQDEYVESVSIANAMEMLVELTNLEPAPTTRIRLSEETIKKLEEASDNIVSDLLAKAYELGIFNQRPTQSPWKNVVVDNANDYQRVVEAVTYLDATYPKLTSWINEQSRLLKIKTIGSLWELNEFVKLLEGLRDILDFLDPQIFSEDIEAMIAATATKQWRKENQLKMGYFQRRALRKLAHKQLNIPVTNPELHELLLQAKEKLYRWERLGELGSLPALPASLTNMVSLLDLINQNVTFLNHYLKKQHGDLFTMDLPAAAKLFSKLALHSKDLLFGLEESRISEQLTALGLNDFTEDMRQRNVDEDQVPIELELAWWASVLQISLRKYRLKYQKGFLPGIFQDHRVSDLLSELYQVQGQVKDYLLQNLISLLWDQNLFQIGFLNLTKAEWMSKLQEKNNQIIQEIDQVLQKQATINDDTIASRFTKHEVLERLFPLKLLLPTTLPQLVASYQVADDLGTGSIDNLILYHCDNLSKEILGPCLAKAKKVIIISEEKPRNNLLKSTTAPAGIKQIEKQERASSLLDESSLSPLLEILPHYDLEGKPSSIAEFSRLVLDSFFSKRNLSNSMSFLPGRHLSHQVSLVRIEATASPAPGKNTIDSSLAEAKEVTRQLIEVAGKRKRAIEEWESKHTTTDATGGKLKQTVELKQTVPKVDSVAIVTFSDTHATRIRQCIRSETDPILKEFLEEDPKYCPTAPFRIYSPSEWELVPTDTVILSVGFTRTPHGKIIHDFGKISTAEGLDFLIQALLVAKTNLILVTSIGASDFLVDRLRYDSEHLLLELLHTAERVTSVSDSVDLTEEPQEETNSILADLALRLHQLGYAVSQRYSTNTKFPIPLVVGPKGTDEFKLAVLFDDESYLDQGKLDFQQLFLPELLRLDGWKVVTLLCAETFANPEAQVNRIIAALENDQ